MISVKGYFLAASNINAFIFGCPHRITMEAEGSLVITKVDEDDDAKYQCVAKNVVGTRHSSKAQLSVLGNKKILHTL